MMMNIRGLILDDPEHTVHLQALTFNARKNADSETEGTISICTEITPHKAPEPVLLGSGDIENGV
jgi:hypothetical protein